MHWVFTAEKTRCEWGPGSGRFGVTLTSRKSLTQLQQALGYQFKDTHWLVQALTHIGKENENNERLEFLGDAALELATSTILYQKFDHLSVGELTVIRSNLVNNEFLSLLANEFGINAKALLGSQRGTDGDARNLCADTLEAIIGAIYLDGGFDAVEIFVKDKVIDNPQSDTTTAKHPKTDLQEWCVANDHQPPVYSVMNFESVSSTGGELWQSRCLVSIDGQRIESSGRGRSKRQAETLAADAMLTQISKLHAVS